MNQGTQDRLIDAAMRLFAEHGYAGASIREITRQADANLGAVSYHFGSKRGLYGRVFEACVGPLAERVRAAAQGVADPVAALERVMAVFFDYLRERPELPQLIIRETVAGRMPPPEMVALMNVILGTVGGLIAAGQRQGLLRGADPRLAAVSVISQPLHLTVFTRMLEGQSTDDPWVRDRLLSHAVSFIRQGLVTTPAGEVTQ